MTFNDSITFDFDIVIFCTQTMTAISESEKEIEKRWKGRDEGGRPRGEQRREQ